MSVKQVVTGDNVPKSSQASVDAAGNIVVDSFEGECRRAFDNLGKILTAAGLGFEDVVQVRNYLGSQKDLAAFNQIYREYFKEPYPARTTIMGCLGDLLKFEVEAIALKR
jgi:2-iminobutanoate/2-iminopropanoate deaminase